MHVLKADAELSRGIIANMKYFERDVGGALNVLQKRIIAFSRYGGQLHFFLIPHKEDARVEGAGFDKGRVKVVGT